jgi:hypothetical protein
MLRFIPALALLVFFAGCGKAQEQKKAPDTQAVPSARSAGGQTAPAVELPASLDTQGDATTFIYRFTAGEIFGYSIRNVERVKMTRDTAVETNVQEVTYRYAFKVVAVAADGSATLQATCLGVTFSGEYQTPSGKKSMSYDSDKANSPQTERTYAKYGAPVKTPFEITVDSGGLITSVGKLDGVIRRLMGDDYKTAKAQARGMIEKDYGENGLKNIVQLAFQTFDGKPVGVDESWVRTWSGKFGYLAAEHTGTYTLKGYSGEQGARQAHFAIALTSRYMGSRKLDTGQGIATMEEFTVRGSGHTAFDMARGRSASRKLVQTVFTKLWVEVPAELKQLQPELHDFWWITDGSVDNEIEPIAM